MLSKCGVWRRAARVTKISANGTDKLIWNISGKTEAGVIYPHMRKKE